MSTKELILASPQVAKLTRGPSVPHRLVLSSTKPQIHRYEIRLHEGKVYALTIYYDAARLPYGTSGLLSRLKAAYGNPLNERDLEYSDSEDDSLLTYRTVWTDQRTRMILTERERMVDGRKINEVVLALTDLSLEQRYNRSVEIARRRQLLTIPVPVPDKTSPDVEHPALQRKL
jgi:hypothetical protein